MQLDKNITKRRHLEAHKALNKKVNSFSVQLDFAEVKMKILPSFLATFMTAVVQRSRFNIKRIHL